MRGYANRGRELDVDTLLILAAASVEGPFMAAAFASGFPVLSCSDVLFSQ